MDDRDLIMLRKAYFLAMRYRQELFEQGWWEGEHFIMKPSLKKQWEKAEELRQWAVATKFFSERFQDE